VASCWAGGGGLGLEMWARGNSGVFEMCIGLAELGCHEASWSTDSK